MSTRIWQRYAVLIIPLIFSTLYVRAEQKAVQDDSIPFLLTDETAEKETAVAKDKPTEKEQKAVKSEAVKEEAIPASTPAVATPGTGKKKLSKIEVTGSHISRVDLEGPSPLLTLDKDYIEQSGATTSYELLSSLPLNNGALVNENKTQGTTPGASTINLHGLGQGATLILINGRRVANYSYPLSGAATFVDLNSIPLAAIDRVEVMKDGASAIYGADAIAGVVNIITKKNYVGTEITAGYGVSAEGDADETSFSLVTGKGSDTSNLTFTFNYFNREGFLLGARDFSRSADHTTLQPTYGIDYTTFGGGTNTLDGSPANYMDTGFGNQTFTNNYDPNPSISAVPDSERVGGTLAYKIELNEELSFFTDISVGQVTTNEQAAPMSTIYGDGIIFPGAHSQNPLPGTDLYLFWRLTDLGPRMDEVVTDNQRIVAGFKGIVKDWDFEAAVNYGNSKSVLTGKNYYSATALQTAFNNNQLNPFGTSTPADLAAIRVSLQRVAESETIGADAKMIGEISQTEAGPVNLAVGVETRRDELTDTPDALIESGDVPGQTGTRSSGHRSLQSAFTELSIPLSDKTEMQLAARIDDYSDFGSSTNPKIAVRYKAASNLILRASAGTAFKAPSLPSMYQSSTGITTESVVDTTRCAAVGDCTSRRRRGTLTGNVDLAPEESTSFFMGAVAEPSKNFTVGVDYWKYDMSNVISYDTQYILDNEAAFPGVVVRGAPVIVGDPGPILSINDIYRNVAKIETDGFDVDLKYVWLTDTGSVMLRSLTSRTLSYKRQFSPGSGLDNELGEFRNPKIKSVLTLAWQGGDYGASLTGNYIGGHQDRNYNLSHDIDSYTTWDTQFAYLGWKGSKLTIGIKNLLDEDPPFSNNDNLGYDYTMYDPTGRFYYASINHQF